MNDILIKQYTKEYNNIVSRIEKIYGIFKEYYDESNLDLWNYPSIETYLAWLESAEPSVDSYAVSLAELYFNTVFPDLSIIIKFPEITVTNEYDESEKIKDVFVKVPVSANGTLKSKFQVSKATYTEGQFRHYYIHSHVKSLRLDSLNSFYSICTGTGPINSTISTLLADNDENAWMILCSQIETFMQVESVQGTPYIRLSTLHTESDSRERVSINLPNEDRIYDLNIRYMPSTCNDMYRDFFRYLLKTYRFTIQYRNGMYKIAGDMFYETLKISRLFIQWFNGYNNPYNRIVDYKHIMSFVTVRDNKFFYIENREDINMESYENRFLFYFKNEEVKLHIISNPIQEEQSGIYILSPDIIKSFYIAISKYLNVEYGYKGNTDSQESGRKIWFL